MIFSGGKVTIQTYPTVGNHEYDGSDRDNGFDSYFGRRLDAIGREANYVGGDLENGIYYSFDLNGWHIVMLNSQCGDSDAGCRDGSPQHEWLERDLADNTLECVMAVFHHPRWSNGSSHGPNEKHGKHMAFARREWW